MTAVAPIRLNATYAFMEATDTLFNALTNAEVLGLAGSVTNLDNADTCVIGQLALMQDYESTTADVGPVQFVADKYQLPYEIAERIYYGVIHKGNVPYFELKLAERLTRIAQQRAAQRRARRRT
jgi:hypothetical protein